MNMKRILIVDDNAAFRGPLSLLLQQAGYIVETAGEGCTALRLFQQHSFDLVITDLIMPEKEGLETIMELRRMQPDLKIIAISGGGRLNFDSCLEMARLLGASKTLSKPFTARQILEPVASLLNAS
jgi:CheY-like chemotaxis protein